MQYEKYQCPLHKWNIYPAETFLCIIPKILQMALFETITGEKEKQRHVEHIDYRIAVCREEGMSQYHQHDTDAFSNGYRIVVLYAIIHATKL